MAGTKTSDTKKTKTDTKKTTDPKETNIPDNKPTERTNTKNPDPQKIPDRYLSDTKLQALCAKKFVPGTYKICVSHLDMYMRSF